MIAAESGSGTTSLHGPTTPASLGDDVVLLTVPRCAVLHSSLLAVAVPAAAGTSPGPSQRFRSSRVREVPTVGAEGLIRAGRPPAGAVGAAGGAGTGAFVEPAALTLTGRSLAAAGTRGGRWDWPLVAITEVVFSVTEPCMVLRRLGAADDAVLVPPADADRLRSALDGALAAGEVEVERPPAPAGPATTVPAGNAGPAPAPRPVHVLQSVGDRVFRRGSLLGGVSVLAIMALVGLFLLIRSITALRASGLSFLTTSEWQPDTHRFGIAAVLTGTVIIALVALVVAIPLATGTALFISEVAPRRFKQTFISMVDLMAAVPSVVYGLWGFTYLQANVIGISRWLSTWFSWIPIFKVTNADPRNPLATASVYTASAFIAGLVVALMVIPISCSIMREVFAQAPAGEREGAYALGATRWGMIRSVVLPFGRGGMIGAVMLGLGRALGETIAVVLIISPLFAINWHILQTGANSVSSLIVLRVGDASGFGLSALMAAGLALFILTLIVNFSASIVVRRSRAGAESEA